MKTLHKIPAKPRSKYYQFSSSSGVTTQEIITSGGSYYNPPYSLDSKGDLVFNDKQIWFNDQNINDDKIISWDEAVKLTHSHNNKTYLDKINQDLGTGRDVTFNNVNFGTLGSAIYGGGHLVGYGAGKEFWRCASDEDQMHIYKSLVMSNTIHMSDNIIDGINWLAFKGYAVEDEMRYNRIWDDGFNGFQFSNKINVYGNLEMTGPDGLRTIYSWNDDMNIIRYDSIGNALSRIRLTNKDVEVDALNVTGSFNCYELVANKVRSTNGYLYVTDSSPILGILYYGYDGNGEAEVKVRIESGRFQQGDYVMIQKMTNSGIVKSHFYVSLVESADVIFLVNKDGYTVEKLKELITVNDNVIRYSSLTEDRRTGIILSPYDGGYIDFYKGDGTVDDNHRTTTTSLGNLDHLNIDGVSGNGLYSDNAYLKGKLFFPFTKLEVSGTFGTIVNMEINQYTYIKNLSDNTNISINKGKDGQTTKIIMELPPQSMLTIGCLDPKGEVNLATFDGIPHNYSTLEGTVMKFHNTKDYAQVFTLDMIYLSDVVRDTSTINGLTARASGWIVLSHTGLDYDDSVTRSIMDK